MNNVRKRLRAIVGNAVLWGIGWGALGFVTVMTLGMTGVVEPVWWLDGVGMAIRIGFAGGIVGAAFSACVSFLYRGRRLQDISPLRFGLGGAAVSGIGFPIFMQTMNILSGQGPVAWQYIRGDVAMLAVFGGAAAALSIKLAQFAIPRTGTDTSAVAAPVPAGSLAAGIVESSSVRTPSGVRRS